MVIVSCKLASCRLLQGNKKSRHGSVVIEIGHYVLITFPLFVL